MGKSAATPQVRFNLRYKYLKLDSKTNKGKRSQKFTSYADYKKSRRVDHSQAALIYAVFRYDGKKLVYYTGCKISELQYWDFKKETAKKSTHFPKGVKIRTMLKDIENYIENIYDELGSLELKDFKLEIDYRTGKKERPRVAEPNEIPFTEFVENEIQRLKKLSPNSAGGQTWRKYQSLLDKLSEFGKKKLAISTIHYEDIDLNFKNKYIEWLRSKEYSQNTISKDIELIKKILQTSRKYHSNYSIIGDLKLKRIQTKKVYPTLEELHKLFEFKFSKHAYQKAIDLYLLSAFGGGLRWSDIIRLSKNNLVVEDGKKFLEVFTYKGRNTKADNQVIIPLTPQFESIMQKYRWEVPKMSNPYVGKMIKKAFEEAQLCREVQVNSAVKDKEPETKRLCDVIKFHSSRSAYISYMLNDYKVSPIQLQKVTGQSLQVLLSYENADKMKNAKKLAAEIESKMQQPKVLKIVS